MSARASDPSPRAAIAVGVIVLAAAIASVLPQLQRNTWIFRDGRFYVNVATTITEDLTLDQHRFASSWYTGTLGWNANLDPGWSNVALGRNDAYYPKHPWIHPLFASPAYFAFGLPATLGWNLLMFALIGAGLYRFARAYADPGAAACAVAVFVIGSAIVQSAYDFSVDVLMLACFAQGLACALDGKGVRAGLLIGICVVIKPTALMLLPALVMLLLERGDRRALGRSLAAGTGVLLALAGINWWMYGRPWWSGYNRTLVTRNGAPALADHLDAFSTPFEEGFVRMWGGGYGLVHTFTVVALAAPGLLVLLRRRPLHGIGTVLGITASLLVFARYEYEGHRFHWPALALAVPAMAVTLQLLARRIDAGAIAGLAAALGCCAVLPFGASAEGRVLSSGPWGERALEVARAVADGSIAPALLAIGVHLAILVVLIASLVRIASRLVAAPLAGGALVACALLPEAREAAIAGGPVAIGLAALSLAGERALAGRRVAPIVLAALAIAALALLPDREVDGTWGLAPIAASIDRRSAARGALAWITLALPGIAVGGSRDRAAGAVLAGLALASIAPGIAVRGELWQPITVLAFAPLAAVAADALARAIAAARLEGRRAGIALAIALVSLLVIGGVRRAIAAAEPFRMTSTEAVERAVVMHDRVPCDFLAWEHMSWECATFDAGVFGLTGLGISEGIFVGGEQRELFLVPTGRTGQPRRVIWDGIEGGRALELTWAVPDGHRGGVILEVLVDDVLAATIEVPEEADGALHDQRIETTPEGGSRLELRVRPRAGRRQGMVALDAVWR